jgi:hypothetical protein
MPFGGRFDNYYQSIYLPAIEEAGLEARRADDLYRPSSIVNDIWDWTKKARILLADLTGKNPNVFYELGLGHALGKPAIMIAESMDSIPFDLRSLRMIIYDKDDPNWGDILRKKIVASVDEVLAAPQEAVLPTFLNVKNEALSVTPHQKEILEIKREIDSLRAEMRSPQNLLKQIQLSDWAALDFNANVNDPTYHWRAITERLKNLRSLNQSHMAHHGAQRSESAKAHAVNSDSRAHPPENPGSSGRREDKGRTDNSGNDDSTGT